MADFETVAAPETAAPAEAPATEQPAAPAAAQPDPALAGQGEPADKAGQPDTSEADKPADDAGEGHEEFTLTPPEGMEPFAEDFQKFATDMDGWLKENPDATAQDALREAATRQAKAVAEQQQKGTEAFETQVTEWETTAKSDKEIGGEKFDENLAIASKALDQFGTPELREALQVSGLGSHPEMIRFAFKAGKALQDPGVVTSATSSQPKRSFVDSLYSQKG